MGFIPVGNVSLMHKSDALCREYQDDVEDVKNV
jgi:hypothetical protein